MADFRFSCCNTRYDVCNIQYDSVPKSREFDPAKN